MFGRSPAEAELQRHFRVSPPTVHQMVLNLERAGLIRRTPGVPRSINLLIEPEKLPTLIAQPFKTSLQRSRGHRVPLDDATLRLGAEDKNGRGSRGRSGERGRRWDGCSAPR